MAGRAFTIGVVATAARIAPHVVDLVHDIAARRYGREVVVRFHPDSFIGHGHFSAQDEVRAAALIDYASASEIDAIWFGRGGYGSARILPSVLAILVKRALQKPYLEDVGAIKMRTVGQFFLRQSSRKAKMFQIGGQNLAQFHRTQ